MSAPTAASAPLLFDSAFLAKLEQLHLLARKRFRGQHRAERRSRQIGASLEFADYRNYAWGDDPRMIDWAVYARLDRLFVKLFEQERDLDIHFLVDGSASMHWPDSSDAPATAAASASTKWQAAARIAAALSYVALANLDRVNVCWFSDVLQEDLGLTRGKSQFHSVLEYLRQPPAARRSTSLEACFRALTLRLKRRGLIFVISDFFDPGGYESPLNLLRHHQSELHLVHVLDPRELDPRLSGDLRLTDCESGQTFDLTATDPLVRDYQRTLRDWLEALERFCLESGVGYARAASDQPFEDLVLRVLRDGLMLR